jgi:hypothetical protein
MMDRDGMRRLLEPGPNGFPRLQHFWLDAAYNGQGKGEHWREHT